MLPGSLGAVLILLALIPGWIYYTRREQFLPSPSRSGLGELLQVAAAGLAFTGLSLCGWMAFSPRITHLGFFDFDKWAESGTIYITSNPVPTVYSLSLIIGLAVGLAFLLSWIQRWKVPPRYSSSPTWEQTLGTGPKDQVAWIGIETTDGRLVEGLLHSYDLDAPGEGPRDIALKRPIFVTGEDEERLPSEVERVIFSSTEIRHLTVQFVDMNGS